MTTKTYKTSKKGQLTSARVAILGMLLALMIALKYAFGFVPGIEVISFLFIFFGIFLPILDLTLLIVSFNLLILVVYGFGTWWFAYWVIWPADAFISKFLSKFTKNKFVFGVWGFIAGFSVAFWYFWSDMIFFGVSFALLNTITAVPINLIEGLTTMLAMIWLAPPMAKVFQMHALSFWEKDNSWDFKEIKRPKLNIALSILLLALGITGIVLLFVFNHSFIEMKESLSHTKNHFIGDKKIGHFKPIDGGDVWKVFS